MIKWIDLRATSGHRQFDLYLIGSILPHVIIKLIPPFQFKGRKIFPNEVILSQILLKATTGKEKQL